MKSWLYYQEVHGMVLVSCPGHGLAVFSRPKVCVYTSCRKRMESDKISKTFSRILLPFCIIKMTKNKLNFMPQSPTMYIANFNQIQQSIEVELLHFSVAAIGLMIMIKECTKWPSLRQAVYKVSPVILDILTALYHLTEWIILSPLYWVYCWFWSWAVRVWLLSENQLVSNAHVDLLKEFVLIVHFGQRGQAMMT